MVMSSGVFKQVTYKAETVFGTAPGASGAQIIRRVESVLDLSKDTFSSNEIRTDMQVADFRHGTRRVKGSLKGELSPKTYADFIAAVVRRDFASVSPIASASITIAGTGPTWTLTRAAGSFLTDGVKVGDVIRLSVGVFNAANLNRNLMVTALTATVATVIVLNGTALVAEGPIAASTVTVVGKKTYMPTSGHTAKSFSYEHFNADTSLSELFTGVKMDTMAIALPPTGMGTIDFGLIGQNITTGSSAYYTGATAASATGVVSAVNGVLLISGTPVANCTGLTINVAGALSGDPVVGQNFVPYVFPGRMTVTGQFTAYFDSGTFRDNFINEDVIGISVALTSSNVAAADFIAFSLPALKLSSCTKTDTEKGIIATYAFTALLNTAGGTGTASEQTTIVVQDSAA